MNDLQKEIMRVLDLHELGKPIYANPGKDGISRADFMRSEPEPLRAPLRQAEPQSLEKTMQDIPAVASGIAGGVGVGLGEAADLGIGLLEGAYKAINPDAGEGRFQSFVSGLAEQFETGYGEQARSVVMDMGKRAGLSPEQLDVMDESITAGSMLSIGGAAKKVAQAVPGVMSKAGDGLEVLGERATAQLAEAPGQKLMSGPPIDDVVNKGFAAAGDAVKKARARYDASPNDPTARRAYLDARHERDAQLSSTPVEEKLETDINYRMMHQPTTPQNGAARLDDMTGGGTVFPDDVYGGDAVRLYGGNNPADQESASIIQSVRGNPEAEVTIYRGVPKDVDTINPGDWVTLSKSYADDHAESGYGQMGDEAGKVISQKVKVKDVYSDGNDLNEFGYFPEDIAETNVAKLEPPTEKQPGVIAFHGSGADFDEFKLEKIGTGEGAQAYGYGLYFAEKEDIAKFYKDTVSEQARKLSYDGKEDAAKAVQTNVPFTVEDDYRYYVFGDAEEVIDNALAVQRGEAPSESYVNNQLMAFDRDGALLIEMPDGTSLSLLKSLSGDTFTATPVASSQEGKMYRVGLEPKPEDMMDYQLPIAEQNPKFLKAFKELYYDRIKSDPQLSKLYPTPDSLTMKDMGLFDKSIVGQAYNTFAKELFNGDEGALTQALLEKGVSGIKYRDAGSRGGAKSLKDASFNYVIFDDKMIKILEKYGIVGPVAITGVAASQQEGESDGRSA